jgi:putative DNA primase/helicase
MIVADKVTNPAQWLERNEARIRFEQAEYQMKTKNMPAPVDVEPELLETQIHIASAFVKSLHGDALYNMSSKKWMIWKGSHWAVDERGEMSNRCREFIDSQYSHLATLPNKEKDTEYKNLKKNTTAQGIRDVLTLASMQIKCRSEDFDINPHILNVLNGTLEFGKDVRLREHRKEDYCSFIANVEYKPTVDCPQWFQHIDKVCCGNSALVQMLQASLGYILDGGNPAEKVFIWYGSGRNGKSVTLRMITEILGNYALTINPLTLMLEGNRQASPERLQMRHKRFIIAQEPAHHQKERSTLDTSFIKSASGRDAIKARPLHSNDIEEFPITGTVCMSTNSLPILTDNSKAIWDRILMFPFSYYFQESERDTQIEDKLMREKNGILNWLVDGWRKYKESGIVVCDDSAESLDEYRIASDEYGEYIKKRLVADPQGTVNGDELYRDYEVYCTTKHQPCKDQRTFGQDMKQRYPAKRTNQGIRYATIRLKRLDELRGETHD